MWLKFYTNELSKIAQTLVEGDGTNLVSLATVALEEGRTTAEILKPHLADGESSSAGNLDIILIVSKVRQGLT